MPTNQNLIIRWCVKNFENEPEVTDISFDEGIFIGATFLGLLNGLFLVEDYDRSNFRIL